MVSVWPEWVHTQQYWSWLRSCTAYLFKKQRSTLSNISLLTSEPEKNEAEGKKNIWKTFEIVFIPVLSASWKYTVKPLRNKSFKASLNKWVTLNISHFVSFHFMPSLMGPFGLFFFLSVVLCEQGGRQQDTWAALRRSNPRRTQVIRLRGSVYQLSSCRGRLEPSWKSTSVYGYSARALRRRWREGTFRGQGVL